jgi:hypothetical protein
MKLLQLQKVAAKARHDLRIAERRAADLRLAVKAAKAVAEKSRLDHKRARKAGKQAKKLAIEAESQAQEQCRVLAKALKRLAKASRKMGSAKAARKRTKPRLAAVARKHSTSKSNRSRPVVIQKPAAPAQIPYPTAETKILPASTQSAPPPPAAV